MNRLSKLLPNPLAGFMCTHVRMSISMRVEEVNGKKINVMGWWTKCWDRLCVRHCVRALTTPRPALSSSSQLLHTTGLRLLCITGGGAGVSVSQPSPWCLLWSCKVDRAHRLGTGAHSWGEDHKLRDNQAEEEYISQTLAHRTTLHSVHQMG